MDIELIFQTLETSSSKGLLTDRATKSRIRAYTRSPLYADEPSCSRRLAISQ
jgi:hypothetical protein